ncbi:endonuclease/exonuclease/phosphatase family protein [Flavobacterium sp.]|uniref:endonuclease/exonuclease/phosphatase family protein n=1 Tax=Flavobacterium sp. TaxID=239 RepID=UPI0026067370|nr:endonuclease/exonuclease/phosphatase family protein [Flavobacterium sp.]
MKIRNLFAFLFLLTVGANAQSKKFAVQTVAFYNLENLFDTINGPNNDEEWLKGGAQNWTGERYKEKLANLSRVLSEIGTGENNPNAPVLIGASEIENRGVLEDLVKQPKMIDKDYGIVHFDSPDKRGIDVGLLYQKKHFQPTSYINIPLYIYKPEDKSSKKEAEERTDDVIATSGNDRRIYTRDQLLVTGLLDGEEINVIVCHWPSRSGGEKKSAPLREAAAALTRKITDSLQKIKPDAKVIILGDLNDGSFNKSVKVEIGAKGKKTEVENMGIYNPFESMANKGMGTIGYRDAWDIFDIIMVSEPFIRTDYSSWRYWKAGIYNKPFMITTTGQYKGYPLRHSLTEVGFSDHFPTYIYLIKEVK